MINYDLTGCKFKYYEKVEIINKPFFEGTQGYVYNCFGSKDDGFRYFVYISDECKKEFLSIGIEEENLKKVFEKYEPADLS